MESPGLSINQDQLNAITHAIPKSCPSFDKNLFFLETKSCPEGQYFDEDMRDCQICGAGTFQNLPGQALCNKCAPGSYQVRNSFFWGGG